MNKSKVAVSEENRKIEQAVEDIKKLSREECRKMGLPYYDETKHWVTFTFLEQPGQKLDFTYGKTVYNPKKANKKGTVHEKYSLKDGDKYELPQYIIEHLSSLVVPDPTVEKIDNQIKLKKGRVRNRFALGLTSPPVENDGDYNGMDSR